MGAFLVLVIFYSCFVPCFTLDKTGENLLNTLKDYVVVYPEKLMESDLLNEHVEATVVCCVS